MKAKEAIERADALLVERLSEEQRQDFARSKSFLVVTPAGRRYRLHADRVNYQADLLAPDSEYVLASYCVQPRDSLVPKSDSLLSQMLLLQTDEARFLLTANVNPKVSSLHRYLNGEIRPREPGGLVERQVVGESRREAAAQRIRGFYPCADHNQPVAASRETDDGRGLDLHYACGCPPQYVSFRQFEQREQARQAGEVIGQRIAAGATDPITVALRNNAITLVERLTHDFGIQPENIIRYSTRTND